MRKRMIMPILIGLGLILSTFVSTVPMVQKIAYAQTRMQPSSNGVLFQNSMNPASMVLGSIGGSGRNYAVQGLTGALNSEHMTSAMPVCPACPVHTTSAQHPIVTIGSGIRYIAGQTNRIIPGGALSLHMTSSQHPIIATIWEKIFRMTTVPDVQKIAYAQARTEPSSNGVIVANAMTHALNVIRSNAESSRSTVVQGLADELSAIHMTSAQQQRLADALSAIHLTPAQQQRLAQAVLILLQVFVRPALAVIGLIAGLILSFVALKILVHGFSGLPFNPFL